VIFARCDEAAIAQHRPLLLLLTEGYTSDPGVAAAAAMGATAGFRTFVVPWFAASLAGDGLVVLAGFEAMAGGMRRPVAEPETLRPDALVVIARPLRLAHAARRAMDGLANASGASVIAPLLDDIVSRPSEPIPKEVALPQAEGESRAAILSFAPPFARLVSGAGSGAEKTMGRLCQTLVEGPLLPALEAAGDPARLLLAVHLADDRVKFGFTNGGDGTCIDEALLGAWLAAAQARCMPKLPFLLPSPAFLRGDPSMKKYPGAPPARLDRSATYGLPALAAILPCPAEGHLLVPTAARADATFDFLDPRLHGPAFSDTPMASPRAALLRHTARSVDEAGPPDPLGWRLVEPGVGRAVIVENLTMDGRPELADFTAVGIGLTPYSRGGFVDVGRAIDGLAALCRARHRRTCADRLETAGCRAAPVAAIATLANDTIDVPGVGRLQAAIALRGFRCVLRVKQLDPIGGFYHSIQHAPLAHDFFTHPLWERVAPAPNRQDLLIALEAYAAGASLAELAAPPADVPAAAARARRLQAIRLYAPMVLDMVRARLAAELGRDQQTEAPSVAEYVDWFARTLGRQFARFRRLRFLHDYHQPEIGRAARPWLYTLGENNVTLLAEFADLDTGVFVDRYDPEHVDEIFLSKAEFATLAEAFDAAHTRDVAAGRAVLRTLAFVALHSDPADMLAAEAAFDRAYAEDMERAK
jgi:hypothetical protein